MGQTVAYISGPITGVENYKEAFNKAKKHLEELGYIVLSPTSNPAGLSNAQYMRIDFAMIDAAHVVYFLPGWQNSRGATLERAYCEYIGKEVIG